MLPPMGQETTTWWTSRHQTGLGLTTSLSLRPSPDRIRAACGIGNGVFGTPAGVVQLVRDGMAVASREAPAANSPWPEPG